MTSRTRTLLVAFALLGLGAASASAYVHYRLVTDPSYSSACDISATVSCTQAYLSRYGSFWGVPVALGGILYFALVLLLSALGGRGNDAERENIAGYIFVLSTVALAFVLYLAWASFFQLKAVCLLCVTTYVAVVAVFIISGGATKLPMTTLPRRAARDAGALSKSPVALLITVLFLGGAAALISMFPREGAAFTETVAAPAPQYPPLTDAQRAEFERWWDVQPKVDMPVDRGRGEGGRREVQRLSMSAVPPDLQRVPRHPREVHRHRAGEIRPQALSARSGVQPVGRPAPCRVRSRRGLRHGAAEGDVGEARSLAVCQPADADGTDCEAGGSAGGRHLRLRRPVSGGARRRSGRTSSRGSRRASPPRPPSSSTAGRSAASPARRSRRPLNWS